MMLSFPSELAPFEEDLRYFFETMVRKLHINRHKGFAEGASLNTLITGLVAELEELKKAAQAEGQFELSLEAVDVANFAFLIAMKAWGMTKADYKEGQPIQVNVHIKGGGSGLTSEQKLALQRANNLKDAE